MKVNYRTLATPSRWSYLAIARSDIALTASKGEANEQLPYEIRHFC
jgi:hypothetical protein